MFCVVGIFCIFCIIFIIGIFCIIFLIDIFSIIRLLFSSSSQKHLTSQVCWLFLSLSLYIFVFVFVFFLDPAYSLSDETGSRDHFRDQNGLESVSRPIWDQIVTLPRVTRLVSRPFLRPKWSRFRSRDKYRHQNVILSAYCISYSESFRHLLLKNIAHHMCLRFSLCLCPLLLGGTGSVHSGTGWYLVVLGQNREALVARAIFFQIYGLHGVNHQII
jgi:hypothetical protein